jgi:hypothetical protein
MAAVAADTAALVSLSMPMWCCGYRIAACGCAAMDRGGAKSRCSLFSNSTPCVWFRSWRNALHEVIIEMFAEELFKCLNLPKGYVLYSTCGGRYFQSLLPLCLVPGVSTKILFGFRLDSN